MKTPKDFSLIQLAETRSFVRPERVLPTAEELDDVALAMNTLFAELKSCCTAWQRAFPTHEDMEYAKGSWLLILIRDGITTTQQIQWGLQRVQRRKKKEYWPSPGDFVSYCQPDPADYGLPSAADAYTEACLLSRSGLSDKSWSHQVIYDAACHVGFRRLSTEPAKTTEPVFEHEYAISVLHFLQDKPLRPMPVLETLPLLPERNPKVAKPALQEIRGILSKPRNDKS